MKTRREYSFSRLTDHIESLIASGSYRSGDKLPPLRELSEQFSLNLDTARRGIWHLRDKGLLDCRRGSGVFVNHKRTQKTGEYRLVVLLTNADLNKTYCAHVLLGIQQAALHSGVVLETRQLAPTELCGALSDAAVDGCDATILLGNYDIGEQPLAFRFPVVGVEMHEMYGGAVSTVTLDPVNAAELAVEYFLRRGIEKVVVLSEATPLTGFRSRMFTAFWRERGGEAVRPPLRSDSGPDLRLLADRQAGYLFTGGEIAQAYSRAWRASCGKHLSDDLAALSIDGKSRILPGYDPIDTIATDWPNAGRIALAEALRRLRFPGTPAERIYLNVKLELIS